MDKLKFANNLSRIENLIPKAPLEIKKSQTGTEGLKNTEGSSGEDFKNTLESLIAQTEVDKPSQSLTNSASEKNILKFSNHAVERMQSRGIMYSQERLNHLSEAVQKAAAKGSKNTLVLMDDSAVIVSVKNNTVVTVMDKNNLKENVFTNIDSTVVI